MGQPFICDCRFGARDAHSTRCTLPLAAYKTTMVESAHILFTITSQAGLARAILRDCQQPYLRAGRPGWQTENSLNSYVRSARVIRLSGDKEISYYLVRSSRCMDMNY